MIIEEKEKFEFTAKAKKNIFITIAVGLVLTIVGIFLLNLTSHDEHGAHSATAGNTQLLASADAHGEHGGAAASTEVSSEKGTEAHGAAEEGHHHHPFWLMRVIKDVWQVNIFLTGIAVMGTFFVAFNYVAWAGWSAPIKRIPLSYGSYLVVSAVVVIGMLAVFGHDLFHWMDPTLTQEGHPHFDEIIASKTWYLSTGFFWARTIIYFGLWFFFWWKLRALAAKEDTVGGDQWWHKSVIVSAGFLVVWGVTESTSSWDWIMSTDPHFFSTMFGWYAFASWFVSALSLTTLIILYLKDAGYLKMINSNHLHDLGKFIFAFSIFWTYIWFEQFLLIYYANIPEEVGYFIVRLKTDPYMPFFFASLVLNFLFPFLGLMTRNAKRQGIMLKVIAIGVLLGHWIDFYNMFTPAILKEKGMFDIWFFFIELGITMVFVGLFAYCAMYALSRLNLIAKNHPMLEESKHHHVF